MSSPTLGIPPDQLGLVGRLSLEQKVRLLTGRDSWVLQGEPAIGLRPIVTSDGPAGARGTHFDPAHPSTSLPCGVALAATWDEGLIEQLTTALGREAHARGIDVLLAPTVNIVRTPFNGRGFECFSEDPFLTSRIAVAYIRGLQKAGVAATVKHFVANDSETDRHTYDARISEQVLREVYLPPFEAAIAEADVFLIMAAYNSVNGATMTANRPLLDELLKREWGFTGVVVSDWHATTSTAESANAGLDLVMPGPKGPWGDRLIEAVKNGSVSEAEIDDKVSRLLLLAQRLRALNGSASPDGSGEISSRHSALIDPAVVRDVTARSFVLLRNERKLLPLWAGSAARVAVIGPNAVEPQTQGGGSVRVLPVKRPGLAESIRDALDVQVTVSQGCVTSPTVPAPPEGTVHDPVTGKKGVRLSVRIADGTVIYDAPFAKTDVTWWDGLPEGWSDRGTQIVIRARYEPEVDGPHQIGAAGVGHVRILIDGSVVGEADHPQPQESVEALSRPQELRVAADFRKGRAVEVKVELTIGGQLPAMRLGIGPQLEDERLLDEAVQAAAAADVAVVVVGSADGTESEGYDRTTLALPGRQDELVRRVAAANPNTVVVINSGMPVLMPWAEEVPAIIQAWLPGQAFGEAVGEVLSGNAEPGGRLPISLPRAEADSPVMHATPDAGMLVYSEGLLVGYRGFDRKGTEPLFGFGHGLGYTEWDYASITPATTSLDAGHDLDLSVIVRNAGTRSGREVVQLYLEQPDDDPRRPIRVLVGFVNIEAEAGESVAARLKVPARAFMRFDEPSRAWVAHPGTYVLRAGRSARDLRLSTKVVMR